MKEGFIQANGLWFYYLEIGEGPLVLCMHGFPDTSRTYRFLLPKLAEAGFRAVAPNMRGYKPTSIPNSWNFQTASLAKDVVALIGALGYDDACLVGHDWGADAVLGASQIIPRKIRRVVAMAEYYGSQATTFAQTNIGEIKRSHYMQMFQSDKAFELFAVNNFAYMRSLWRSWSPQYTLPEEEMDHIVKVFSQPGVTVAALTYDRCALNKDYQDKKLEALQAYLDAGAIMPQALVLYGEHDGCHGKETIEAMPEELFWAGTKEMVPGAGHFLHLEQPEYVDNRIISFLQS